MNPQEFVSIHTLLISPIPILLCLTTEDYTHTTLIITNSSGSCYLTGSTEFCEILRNFMRFHGIS
jgi:hypothetical protein